MNLLPSDILLYITDFIDDKSSLSFFKQIK